LNGVAAYVATARVFGISAKRYRELRATVTEALARERKQSAKKGPRRGGVKHAEADRSLSDTRLRAFSSTSPTIRLGRMDVHGLLSHGGWLLNDLVHHVSSAFPSSP
jgi:hypothetical protein